MIMIRMNNKKEAVTLMFLGGGKDYTRKCINKLTYVDEAVVEEETEDRCTRSRLAVNGRFNG